MNRLLDSNVWIKMLQASGKVLFDHYVTFDRATLFSCSPVRAELFHGAEKYGLPERRRQALSELLGMHGSFPFDDRCAEEYARIRHYLELRGEVIGMFDMQIAAVALVNDLTVVTSNTGEFRRIPGLRVEDWSL